MVSNFRRFSYMILQELANLPPLHAGLSQLKPKIVYITIQYT